MMLDQETKNVRTREGQRTRHLTAKIYSILSNTIYPSINLCGSTNI